MFEIFNNFFWINVKVIIFVLGFDIFIEKLYFNKIFDGSDLNLYFCVYSVYRVCSKEKFEGWLYWY